MDRHWYLDQTNVLFKYSDHTQLFFQNHNRERSCSVNHTSLKNRHLEGCLCSAARWSDHILPCKVNPPHCPSIQTARQHQVHLVSSPNVLSLDLFLHPGEFLVGLNPVGYKSNLERL